MWPTMENRLHLLRIEESRFPETINYSSLQEGKEKEEDPGNAGDIYKARTENNVQTIKRRRRYGHVQKMGEGRLPKQDMSQYIIRRKKRNGRPKTWMEEMKLDNIICIDFNLIFLMIYSHLTEEDWRDIENQHWR